ncbi:hypothetical protein AMS68_000603 [Peltaster fructicola]|uniref:Uncharacterized protein n=1 Tax=Peltaster fructicola TaxID=286661 RepID=A0A6H0XK47_9PEZI|nr:hypothetical protein AMS68_000603 [Peltaster fructicola]
MCVAGLNVSTQTCAHRWYQLVRPCNTERNLANCTDKLRLEGWENRSNTCPWCDNADEIADTTHRLLGSFSTSSSTPPASPELPGMLSRANRSGSVGTLSTLSSLSRHGSTSSGESERGLRQREQNDRFNLYLTSPPHDILPSARRNYPTSPRDETTDSDGASIVSAGGMLKGWKKSMKFGKGMFKG